uniref:RING-type E3 ubiquitin transferase n=1 Tax=Oryza rufipogon TaxID=4529 RepID=A0A0E0MQM3_ORYRU
MDGEQQRNRANRLEDGKGRICCEDHHRRKEDSSGCCFALLQHLLQQAKKKRSLELSARTLLAAAVVSASAAAGHGMGRQGFLSYCPPSRCSEHGPEIRFPFQLESNNTTPSSCSVPCMKLACSGQDTILDSRYSYLGSPYKVTAIDYKHTTLTIIPIGDLDSCPLLNSVPLPSQPLHYHYHGANWSSCDIYNWGSAALVSCSQELTQTDIPSTHIAGPISCLSTNSTHFSYLVAYDVPTCLIPIQCEVISDGPIPIPYFYSGHASLTFRQSAERILNFADTTVYWRSFANPAAYNCSQCEQQGRRCAYSSQRNQTFCMRRGTVFFLQVLQFSVYNPLI